MRSVAVGQYLATQSSPSPTFQLAKFPFVNPSTFTRRFPALASSGGTVNLFLLRMRKS
jgi:hypothetical protein